MCNKKIAIKELEKLNDETDFLFKFTVIINIVEFMMFVTYDYCTGNKFIKVLILKRLIISLISYVCGLLVIIAYSGMKNKKINERWEMCEKY